MDFEQLYVQLAKDPKRWNIEDVTIWLKVIGLQEFELKFKSNAIDGALLTVLDESDLNEIGITEQFKTRDKLLQWIKKGFEEYSRYVKEQGAKMSFKLMQDSEESQVQLKNIQNSSLIASNTFKKSLLKAVTFYENQDEYIYGQKQNSQVVQGECYNGLMLILLSDQNKKLKLTKDDFTIGRNFDNSLVLTEDYISRQHCKISFDQIKGCYHLQDLGSTTGTFVKLINPLLLQERFIIQMGQTQYRIEKIQIYGQTCSVQVRIVEGVLLNQTFDFELHKFQTALIVGKESRFFSFDQVINILSKDLSNQHAQFTFIDEGLVIEDLGSLNGTWLRLSFSQQPSEKVKLINERIFRLAYQKLFLCVIN